MKTLRAVLVGYGLGGSAFHAPFLASTEGLTLAAVVTHNPERQAAVRKRYPNTEVISGLHHVWAHAQDFDLVVVSTPNRHHVAHATAALRHGLPVVVDKPFAATLADARALAELAGERGLLLSPFHNRRYDGDFLTVQRLLAQGRLGKLHRFESRFERWRPNAVKGSKAWKESADPADAGGIVFDLGSHLIDQALVLSGRPTHVYAEVGVRRKGAVSDDEAFVALTHADGSHSHLWMSAVAADLGPRFRVLGGKAGYVKSGMDPQEEALKQGTTPGGPDWGAEPESAWGRVGVPDHYTPEPTEPGAYQRYYAAIAQALATKSDPPVTAADGIAVLEVIEAAYESGRTGATVRLTEPSTVA